MSTHFGWQTTWQGWSYSAAFHACLLSSFALMFHNVPEAAYRLGAQSAADLTVELSLFESESWVPPGVELDVVVEPLAARVARQEYRLDLETDGDLNTSSLRLRAERAAPSADSAVTVEGRALAPDFRSDFIEMPKLPARNLRKDSRAVTIPFLASTVVRSPEFVENRPPIYPRQAITRGWQGTVWLRLRIAKDGYMLEVSVEESSGHLVLDAAAVAAVRQWRAAPLDESTAEVVRLPVRFEMP